MTSLKGRCGSPSPFCRQSAQRASIGTFKQPKLPGSERFRFHSSSENLPGTTVADTAMVLRRTLEPFQRSPAPRRAKILISKQTSRVLNNTNTELSADAIEFIQCETSRVNDICKDYVETRAARSDPMKSHWSERRDGTPDRGQHRVCLVHTEPDQNWMHLRNQYGQSGMTSPSTHSPPDLENVWVRRDVMSAKR